MPSKRVRNGKTIWIGAVDRRGFRKESTFRTKIEALKWEDDLRELLKSHIPIQDIQHLLDMGISPKAVPTVWEQEKTPTISLLELANGYLNHAKLAVSNDQYQEKRRVLKRFLKWHGNPSLSVESLRAGQVHDYLYEQARLRSNHAANKDRTHLGAAWNWGIKYDKCPSPNPFLKVEKLPHDVKHHYMPPLEDFLKVVGIADEQDTVLLWTYYYTAGRRQEVLNLKWDDIDFNRKRLRLYTRKRRGGNLEADWVDMTDHLAEMLGEHRSKTTSDYVFIKLSKGKNYLKPFKTGRRKWPKALCERAGVKPFGCHGIRALTATTLAYGDTPMIAIKQHLRHRNVSVTEAYVRGHASIRHHLTVLEGGKSKASALVVNG